MELDPANYDFIVYGVQLPACACGKTSITKRRRRTQCNGCGRFRSSKDVIDLTPRPSAADIVRIFEDGRRP